MTKARLLLEIERVTLQIKHSENPEVSKIQVSNLEILVSQLVKIIKC